MLINMENNEIATKIKQIYEELVEFKTITDKRLCLNEEKFSHLLNGNFEVKARIEEGQDFVRFLRTGEVRGESLLETKARKGSFEGGIPVSENSNSLIAYSLEKLCVMRRLCKVQRISSDSFDVIIEENGGKATWGTPTQKEPFVKKFIKVHEIVAEPKATSKLIEDVKVDIEKFMSEKIAESFALAEDEAFLHGTGLEMPKGLLKIENGLTANAIEHVNGDLTCDGLLNLISKLDPFYTNNTAFLMNKETESLIKLLKDASGRHIWQSKLLENEHNTIFGVPVFINNFMPEPKKGNIACFYGNFEKGYKIIEKQGSYMMRDPYTERPFIKFYTAKKVGGDVVNGNAIKALKLL